MHQLSWLLHLLLRGWHRSCCDLSLRWLFHRLHPQHLLPHLHKQLVLQLGHPAVRELSIRLYILHVPGWCCDNYRLPQGMVGWPAKQHVLQSLWIWGLLELPVYAVQLLPSILYLLLLDRRWSLHHCSSNWIFNWQHWLGLLPNLLSIILLLAMSRALVSNDEFSDF